MLSDKRLVDYVFLAGLPTDFRINPKKQGKKGRSNNGEEENLVRNDAGAEQYNSTETENDAREEFVAKDDTELGNSSLTSNVTETISTSRTSTMVGSTPDNDDGNAPETFNSISKKLLDRFSADLASNDEESKILFSSLFENVVSNILKFDQERDEFLKSGLKIKTRKSLNINDDGGDGNERESIINTKKLSKLFKDFDDDGDTKRLSKIDDKYLDTDSVLSFSSSGTSKAREESGDNRRSYQNVIPQQPSSKQNAVNPDASSHPLRQKFSPKLLSRYPKYDYPKEGDFPAYVPMFCFPNDITIRESDECPASYFHGFVMTQEDNSQRYGVCLTTFEPIPDSLFEELNEQQISWRESNMSSSEIEYAEHLSEKIRTERKRVETARTSILLQGRVVSNRELEEAEKVKTDAKEKLGLYKELLQPIKLGILDKSNLWVPKCIGVVSHLPWHDILKDWLCAVVMPMVEGLKERNDPIKSLIPLERYVVNLVHEVPLPPPGKLQVALSINETTLFCARPSLNQLPIMKDFSLYPLFRSLSIKNIVTLFEVALSEKKILITSSYPDMLYLVAYSIKYLIYPFKWQGVFIPVLPARLMACLQAPVPYIMGIEKQYRGIDLMPEDACIVDVDKDTILMADLPVQIPSRQRKKLIQSLETYSPLRTRFNVPLGVPVFIQQAYPNGRFMPTSNKSKMYDTAAGSNRIGSVIGAPARAIPLAPSMKNLFNPENGLMKSDDSRIDQALHLAPIAPIYKTSGSNRSSSGSSISSNASDLFGNNKIRFTVNTSITYSKHIRSSVSMGNIKLSEGKNLLSLSPALQRRFSSNDSVNNIRNEKSLDKFGKLTKQKFSSITGGARNSIISFKNKALTRNSLFSLKTSRSANVYNNSIISPPTSPDTINFSDDLSSTICSDSSYNTFIPEMGSEQNYTLKEGHFMVLLPPDNEAYGQKSGINIWMMEGLACGICRNSLGINPIYKCEGCSMMIHDECLTDVVYPCVPACFDESKILETFIRVFASLFSNYRDFLVYDNTCSYNDTNSMYERGIIEDEFDTIGDANELFKKDLFLKTANKDAKVFLSSLVNSQSFSQFIAERTTDTSEDHDIRYFDEVIKAKLNRSKLKLSKESTSFLNDSSFYVSQTVRAMKPNEEGLDKSGFEGYIRLPDCFDTELMTTPRPVRDGWANGFGKGWR